MITRYLRENGYQGIIPEVLLTDEIHSFTVDSKDKETGAKRREKMGNENKVFTEEEWTTSYNYLKNFPRNTSVSMSISLSPLFTLYSISNNSFNLFSKNSSEKFSKLFNFKKIV